MQVDEAQEHIKDILQKSEKKIRVLNILVNFFNNQYLLSILVKTKVIHGLFKNNRDLDINKLDLFHIQYTDSLIDLFKKLKKSKELQYSLLSDEFYLNQDIISNFEKEQASDQWASLAREHARFMSGKLEQLYQMLAFDIKNTSFDWADITAFTVKNSANYYREISDEYWQQLTGVPLRKSYANGYITIESRLLTRLSSLGFRIKFRCGLSNKGNILEIFNFRDNMECFAATANHQFFLLDDSQINGVDLSANISNKMQIIAQLKVKNVEIQEQMQSVKISIHDDILEVLKGYLDKISDLHFLEDLQSVDEQTNILRAMLNVNINLR